MKIFLRDARGLQKLLVLDVYVMDLLDRCILLAWNQLSWKKIFFQRAMLAVYVITTLVRAVYDLADPANADTLGFNATLWGIIISAIALIFYHMHRRVELVSKYLEPKLQNFLILAMRVNFGWVRLLMIALGVLVVTAAGSDAFKATADVACMISWLFYMLLEHTLVPTEPPKRWKFKLKLPKFEFNLNPPLPQGV